MSDTIQTYEKIPVQIQAVMWTGFNEDELLKLAGESNLIEFLGMPSNLNLVLIHTLEGIMRAKIGDYIIKGVSGELYPCKPDIFAKTYKQVTK